MYNSMYCHPGESRGKVSVFSIVYNNSLELIERFAERGAFEKVNTPVHHGWPPLLYASRGDKGEHPDRVGILLKYGADVHIRGPKGATALHTAAKAGFVSVIDVLVEHGGDINARMNDGATPLCVAMKAKRDMAVERIRQYGGER